jgi:hypothetical protein
VASRVCRRADIVKWWQTSRGKWINLAHVSEVSLAHIDALNKYQIVFVWGRTGAPFLYDDYPDEQARQAQWQSLVAMLREAS